MNVAYIRELPFDKLSHDNCGSDVESPSVRPVYAYHASLDSPKHVKVGTIVELFPIDTDVLGNLSQNVNPSDSTPYTLMLHPLLLTVLIKSSQCAEKKSMTTRISGDDKEQKYSDVLRYPIIFRSKFPICEYPDEIHDSFGWLECIPIKNMSHEGEQNHITIILRYMCSNSPRFRSHFNERFVNAETINKNFSLDRIEQVQNNVPEDYLQLLMKKLVGQVIAQGSILAINIDDSHQESDGHNSTLPSAHHHDQEVAFFMVEEISVLNRQSSDESINKIYVKLVKLDSNVSEVSFQIKTGQKKIDNNSAERSNVHTNLCAPMNLKMNNVYDMQYSCPGYETTLEELLSLAMLRNPYAAPTAVILAGCSGVGKSRMASLFEREMSRISSAAGVNLTVSMISAKDIIQDMNTSSAGVHTNLARLLGMSDFSSDIAPEASRPNTFATEYNFESIKRLFIIDDLDVMIDNTDYADILSNVLSSSHFRSEHYRALNDVTKLLDAAVADSSRRTFILGISQVPLAQLPSELVRVGRFEKEVAMSSPTLHQRKDIFKFWLSILPLKHSDDVVMINKWVDILAPRTAGCVAADIRRICADALSYAVAHSAPTQEIVLRNVIVEWTDMKKATRSCIPSQLCFLDVIPAQLDAFDDNIDHHLDAKKEFDLAWKGFGGYNDMKSRLFRTIVRPWTYHTMEHHSQNSSIEEMLGVSKPSGLLFHGPPGNGKSYAAMCLASSLGLNCVKVKASEVFNQWLGGSEATLRSIFSRARAAAPCILFFDELDSLAMNREADDSSVSSGVQSRILTTLLNEIDGITNSCGNQSVLVIAATNRLDAIDAALLRPGRLEEHVLLSYPDASSVLDILEILTAKIPLDSVDLSKYSILFAAATTSCAELEGICRDASLIAMRNCTDVERLDKLSVTCHDIDEAFHNIRRK